MTLITAPDGAIFSLLAIAASAPIVPDEGAEIWLREQSLMHDTPGGVTELTSRGRAYLGMILATPLPVRIEEWGDPRGISAPPPPSPTVDAAALAAAIVAGLKGSGIASVAPARAPAATVPPGAKPITVVTTIPSDFTETPASWRIIPPGQWPAALPPDGNIQVIYRDGRLSAVRAVQSIIWQHKDHVDDVMAYKYLGGDTITPVITAPTTNPA